MDRIFLSRFSTDTVGILVHKHGVLADADGAVTVAMIRDADAVSIFTRTATHQGVGTYTLTFASAETDVVGSYTLLWSYNIDGLPQSESTSLQVGESSPEYDALDGGFKEVVESVWIRFADLFDYTYGGPHLQFYFQTHFGRNRMAQLLRVAVGRMNTIAQPHQSYSLTGTKKFPFEQWGALLEQALYVEALKHLRRSYVEQPSEQGLNLATLDRRDYMDRWGEILKDEEEDLDKMLDVFKISSMFLGAPRVLVSGGAYGRYGPVRTPGLAAQPRYWARFYG